jgi:uncharacterized membrane protein YphA (DoxX/SURF4 family)
VALFLLRLQLATASGLIAAEVFIPVPIWASIPLYLLSVLLIAGFLTPLLSVASGSLCVSAFWLLSSPANLIFAALTMTPLALGFIGPGAYSIDARLFGRRTIVRDR